MRIGFEAPLGRRSLAYLMDIVYTRDVWMHRIDICRATGRQTLRHAFITAALDAGVPLRDVQEAASHADPRTTMRYDRARTSLDRHATYIVAADVAGAAR